MVIIDKKALLWWSKCVLSAQSMLISPLVLAANELISYQSKSIKLILDDPLINVLSLIFNHTGGKVSILYIVTGSVNWRPL